MSNMSEAERLAHRLWSSENIPGSTPLDESTRKAVWQALVGEIRLLDLDRWHLAQSKIKNPKGHFVSESCRGELCAGCWHEKRPATHKLGEEILHDDPNPVRHNLTAYVCCTHFRLVVGGTCNEVG